MRRKQEAKITRMIELALLKNVSISLLSINFNLPEKAVKGILRGIKK